MTEWDDVLETCMHGVTEGIDSHPCTNCAEMARTCGYDMSEGRTYLFKALPRARDIRAQCPKCGRMCGKDFGGERFYCFPCDVVFVSKKSDKPPVRSNHDNYL